MHTCGHGCLALYGTGPPICAEPAKFFNEINGQLCSRLWHTTPSDAWGLVIGGRVAGL